MESWALSPLSFTGVSSELLEKIDFLQTIGLQSLLIRSSLIRNVLYLQRLWRFVLAKGVGAGPIYTPRANLPGDHFFSDSPQAVL
jgi:hypothetical protein